MKHISFRIIFLCVLLPPICYGFTIQGLEYYLGRKYKNHIEQNCVGDLSPLFQGSVRLKDAVSTNIDRYLQQQHLISWGVKALVWVTTGSGVLLYPASVEETYSPPLPSEAYEIASENYSLLYDRLSVTVDVELGFGRLLPNMIMAGYILLALFSLYGMYRVGSRKAALEEAALGEKLQQLRKQEQALSTQLSDLKKERNLVTKERDRLEQSLEAEKRKAGNEAELFDEIVLLEEKLKKNILLQQQQEKEIKDLSEKISAYDVEVKKTRPPRGKKIDVLTKRFGALYKNITVHEQAVAGFAGLTEEMKIKCEEMIHRLNEAPEKVPIKRKVFSGKGRSVVWEVLFSYNGRLYFRHAQDQKIEVIVVGNKNTQSKDLEFIDKISRKSK